MTGLVRDALPWAAIVAGASMFRLVYYGSVVPNTYTLKATGIPLFDRVMLNGIPYVTPLLGASTAVLIAALIVLVLRPSFESAMLAALPVSMLLYTVYVGGDALPDFRFTAPYIPYAYLVVLVNGTGLAESIAARSRPSLRESVVGGLFTVALGALVVVDFARQPFALPRLAQDDNIANVNTALYLRDVLGPKASVGVFYAGAIPYYTGLKAFDFLGKSDPHIARVPPDTSGRISWGGMLSVPGHNKYDLNYSILRQSPTFVAGLRYGSQDVTRQAMQRYEAVPVMFRTWSDYDPHAVLLLRGSPDVKVVSTERVRLASGFFDLEHDATGQEWRWAGEAAQVLLKNDSRSGVVRLKAEVPLNDVTVTLSLAGRPLETFVANAGTLDRQYVVDAATLGSGEWLELVIQTDKVLRSSQDPRALALRVFSLTWQAR